MVRRLPRKVEWFQLFCSDQIVDILCIIFVCYLQNVKIHLSKSGTNDQKARRQEPTIRKHVVRNQRSDHTSLAANDEITHRQEPTIRSHLVRSRRSDHTSSGTNDQITHHYEP